MLPTCTGNLTAEQCTHAEEMLLGHPGPFEAEQLTQEVASLAVLCFCLGPLPVLLRLEQAMPCNMRRAELLTDVV
jgi:hypothetical protein